MDITRWILGWAARRLLREDIVTGELLTVAAVRRTEVLRVSIDKLSVLDGWMCPECERWEEAARFTNVDLLGPPRCYRHGLGSEDDVPMVPAQGMLPR